MRRRVDARRATACAAPAARAAGGVAALVAGAGAAAPCAGMREARAAARGGRWRRRRGPALLAAVLGGILLLAGARLLALRAAAVEGGVHELHAKGNARAGGGLHAGAWAGIGPAGVPDVVPGAGVRAAELVSNARCSARRQHLALSSTPHNAERAELYSSIAAKLLHGPSSSPVPQSLAPLAAGVLSQGLQITDLYERGPGGKWTPRSLPPLEVPVRAIVVPVSVDVDAAGALGQGAWPNACALGERAVCGCEMHERVRTCEIAATGVRRR